MLYNINRDPKKPAAKPADFDPFTRRKKKPDAPSNPDEGKAGFAAMRAIFCPDSLRTATSVPTSVDPVKLIGAAGRPIAGPSRSLGPLS